MSRTKTHPNLRIYHNGGFVGELSKQPSGAITFAYADAWLNKPDTYPVSLSLPLREDVFKGAQVSAVFENLLPDSESLRARVAEKVGAEGTDAYSLLAQIGRDCVGAWQFYPEGMEPNLAAWGSLHGEEMSEDAIESLLKNLDRAPLGLDREHDFRISIAGAQEKTSLLFHKGKWKRPIGPTPTTHIFKTQIGKLPNGIDLSNSVENEFYGLTVMKAFGLDVNEAEIKTFGTTKALVIQRFDRRWTPDGFLRRLPQEDCCQALSIPPSLKYQNERRPSNTKQPSMVEILNLLKGSDRPAKDQKTFLKAQILFWLIGATDGHAKNFSLFLGAGGRFQLTPLYDVLTAQPFFDKNHTKHASIKLAMSVGANNHYRLDEIHGRHFVQTAQQAGVPITRVHEVIDEITSIAQEAMHQVEKNLPPDFPEEIHSAVTRAMRTRLVNLPLQTD